MSKEVKVRNGQFIDKDILAFHEGKNYWAYKFMGAHITSENRKKGVRFTTWAPNATKIYVVGEFSNFEPLEEYKMKKLNDRGLWSLFIKGIKAGEKYKYYIVNENSNTRVYKSDPYAVFSEYRPNTASIVREELKYRWLDKKWLNKRDKTNIKEQPMNIYEIHLGSWKKKDGEFLTYSEMKDILPKYLKSMNYTHVEFMPLAEYPFDGSWGYQATGYYSATSRYGDPKDLKALINELHRNDIGVIMDWVPGHFCKDEHGLYRFDGGNAYEYEEFWKANNKGWGTFNFDLGRPEVKSFLISNAFYWIKEFHIDGIRVDAVSNMLYLNYGREDGEWVPNKYGGDGCLEAIEFLKDLNSAVKTEFKNVAMVAEESTSWPNITKPIEQGGLGFDFKWNMGWMNDTLKYVEIDPIFRKYNHEKMNFSMMYNYSENFILPLSHDEVVHGKKSIVNKMWGDYWNKFAGARAYLAFMMGHPGKKLNFMGYELGEFIEWKYDEELAWNLVEDFESHKKHKKFIAALNKFYLENKALYKLDYEGKGFEWIDADNKEKSIFTFVRHSNNKEDTLIFICNFTPVVYYDFELGVPSYGGYREVFNTDSEEFGGSNQINDATFVANKKTVNNREYSIKLKVPPMAVTVLSYIDIGDDVKGEVEGKEFSDETNKVVGLR